MATPADPFAVLRTKKYLALLILATVLGVVISFLIYWLLKLIAEIQTWVFTDLPKGLGFHGEPPWWPLLPLARRDMEPSAGAVIAAAGSFAAISTLLGNPLAGAFLLLEASGLGGPMATVVLLPGMVGAGVGYLIFLGLNAWTGGSCCSPQRQA